MKEVFVSDLPGAPRLAEISREYRRRDGTRCGCSAYIYEGEKRGALVPGLRIEICHFADPLPLDQYEPDNLPPWKSFETQQIHIAAWHKGKRAGYLNLQRYEMADSHKVMNVYVWSAHGVGVEEGYRGGGVASAMYAHARAMGYLIGPSHNIIDHGRRLWGRLDPTITIRGHGPEAQEPRVPVPFDDRSGEALTEIWHRHRPHANLSVAWQHKLERAAQEPVIAELLDAAVAAADGLFTPKVIGELRSRLLIETVRRHSAEMDWAEKTFANHDCCGFGMPVPRHRTWLWIGGFPLPFLFRAPWLGRLPRRRAERQPFLRAADTLRQEICRRIREDADAYYDKCQTCECAARCPVGEDSSESGLRLAVPTKANRMGA